MRQMAASPLADYLRRSKLRGSDFARLAGLDPSYVWRLVKGDRSPGIRAALAIEVATGRQIRPEDWKLKPRRRRAA